MAKLLSYGVVAIVALAAGAAGGHYLGPRSEKTGAAKPELAIQEFAVEGMSCEGCVGTVTKAAQSVPGVQAVKVSLPAKKAVVAFDPASASAEGIETAIDARGYKAHVLAEK